MGDISARCALTIHHGTANISDKPRPALVFGVNSPDGVNAERHGLQLTKGYEQTVPKELLQYLTYSLVAELKPIIQAHTIEGSMIGEAWQMISYEVVNLQRCNFLGEFHAVIRNF